MVSSSPEVSRDGKTKLFPSGPYIKCILLLDEVFMVARTIKVEVGVSNQMSEADNHCRITFQLVSFCLNIRN